MFLGSVRLFLESNFLCLYMYMPDGIFTNRVHYHSTTTSVAVSSLYFLCLLDHAWALGKWQVRAVKASPPPCSFRLSGFNSAGAGCLVPPAAAGGGQSAPDPLAFLSS